MRWPGACSLVLHRAATLSVIGFFDVPDVLDCGAAGFLSSGETPSTPHYTPGRRARPSA